MHKLITAIILWISISFQTLAMPHCPEVGICDLRSIDWSVQNAIILDGEWQFYWKQHLSPQEIREGKGELTGMLHPKKQWDTVTFGDLKLENFGYATYHKTLLLNGDSPLTISFTDISSASAIWINEEKIIEIGQIADNANSEQAHQRRFFHTFIARDGINTITIQMSNFSNYYLNASSPIKIGPADKLYSSAILDIIRDSIVFGAIIIMVFYHFYLWFIRPSRFSPLYYGVFCLALGLRSLVMGQGELLTFLFPNFNFELQYKFEYLGMSIGVLAVAMLIRNLYPNEFRKSVFLFFITVNVFWSLLIFFSKASIYPQPLRIYQYLTLSAGISFLISLIIAAKRGREGAKLFLAGFFIFFLTAVNDLLVALDIIDFHQISHFGVFGFIFFQSLILSSRFDKDFDRAEKAEKEVRLLNEELEIKVKERTEAINIILENAKSGFLAIDREGRILPGFTQSCHEILKTKIEVGQNLLDYLKLKPSVREHFEIAISQIFDDLLPVTVSLAQIPSRLEINGGSLSISGAEIREQGEQKIKAILLTINDATSLQNAERKIRYNEMLLTILKERESFALFLQEFYQQIERAIQAIYTDKAIELRNLLHTMKGNFGAFGVYEVAELIHMLEEQEQISIDEIIQIKSTLEQILQDNQDLMQFVANSSNLYQISKEDLAHFKSYVRETIIEPERSQIIEKIDLLCEKPIQSYLDPLTQIVQTQSHKQGKDIDFEMLGADIKVGAALAPLFRSLVHLVRNAVDHGIEFPEERGQKPETGQIKLKFTKSKDALEILLADDGRGLDLERIRQKAIASGIMSENEILDATDSDISHIIFHPNFSTLDKVSDISGRGIGMTAVKEAVDKVGGTIEIQSKSGDGTQFLIKIPLKENGKLANFRHAS